MIEKIVGVTQRIQFNATYDEYRDELDHRLIEWVLASGHIPVPIPNDLISLTDNESAPPVLFHWLLSLNVQAIVLTGGNDVGEFDKRDNTENYLLSWAEKNTLPVLGICRGMQLMGIRNGGKLVQVEGHVKSKHRLELISEKGNLQQEVNSYHNFSLKECPRSFQPLAFSNDGYLEAMSHKKLPWEAWMWHPERELEFDLTDIQRFRKLLDHE